MISLKYFFVTLLICFLVIPSKSQNIPGYLGKRFIIHGTFLTRSSLNNPTKDKTSGITSFNKTIGLDLEVCINNRSSVLISLQRYSTIMDYRFTNGVEETDFKNLLENIYGLIDVNSTSIEYRKYRNVASPLGSYFGIILEHKNINFSRSKSLITAYSYGNEEIVSAALENSLISAGISVGKQKIFFNRLAVSAGANFLFPIQFRKMGWFRPMIEEGNYIESYNLYRRLFFHDLANFKASAGFLF